MPWLVIGDLNETLSSDEKFGGISKGQTSSKYLSNFLKNTNGIDLGFNGYIYLEKQ